MKPFLVILILTLSSSCLRAQGENEHFTGHISARTEYRRLMRANAGSTLTANALMAARSELGAKRMLSKPSAAFPSDAGIGGWEWLGPGNIGGRIRSILVLPTVPSTMWIGSVSGGIWRTDNAGDSWYPLNDFLPSLEVTSLIMDPTSVTTLYAATGEGFSGAGTPPGAGIFKSTDAGLSWNELSSTADNPDFAYVNCLSHHPTASNILLAATNSGVWRTINGGSSWLKKLSGNALQVKYHPSDPNRVLCGTNKNFYLSTDGGLHWTIQTDSTVGNMPKSPGRCQGDFSATDSSIYVNMDRNLGEVWYSSNGNRTWQLRNTGYGYFGISSQGDYDNAIWIDPTNSAFILVGGRNLQRSFDGGLTMTKIGGDDIPNVHPDIHAIVSPPSYNGTTNKTVYIGCDGGIYATGDITSASTVSGWISLNHNLGITQFYGGSASPDGSLIAGGAQDNDRLQYTPGGGPEGWYIGQSSDYPGGDATLAAVDFTDPSKVYMASTSLYIGRSDDGGHTYHKKYNGLGDSSSALWAAPLVMDPNDAKTLFAGGANLWKTTDRAETWTLILGPIIGSSPCTAIDVAPGNSNVVWAGYVNGSILRTLNGGASFDSVNIRGVTPNAPVTDIAINPAAAAEVMVTFGGYMKNQVWFTSNGGLTWQSRSGNAPLDVPAIQVNTVRFHPLNPDYVYLGTDLGVFASYDKGLSWNILPLYPGSDGPANVEVDELFWQGSQFLIAATYGRGMFRTQPFPGIFVDLQNPSTGDGTYANPFQQIHDAISAQVPGTALYIKSGTYQQGPVMFSNRGPVYIWNGPVIIK